MLLIKRPAWWLTSGLVLLALNGCATLKESGHNKHVYVSLKDSGKVERLPDQTIWKGAPVMLYDSITPDGKRLVVSSPKMRKIYVFDSQTGKRLAEVAVGKASKGVKVSPDGKEAYVANEGEATVSVVNLDVYKNVATIPVKEMPHNIRFNSDGSIAYVTLQGGAGLGVINTKQRKLVQVIPTPGLNGPHNMDLSKDEHTMFIRGVAGQVGVLDLDSDKMIKVMDVGKGHAGIDVIPNGKLVFTGAIADDYVTVIDARTLKDIKHIKVGFGPHGVRASADNKFLYTTVTADNKIVVIDINKLAVVKKIDADSFPFWAAIQGNP